MLLSDHSAVSANLHVPKSKCVKRTIEYRSLKDINVDDLRNDLQDLVTKSNEIYSANELVTLYDTGLKPIIDKHAPLKSKTVYEKHQVPWFDATIKSMKRDKRRLERIWKRSKKSEDFDNYKICRNILSEYIKSRKRTVYSQKVLQCDNSKSLYQTVFNLIDRKSENPLPDLPSEQCATKFAVFFSRQNTQNKRIAGRLPTV